MLITQVHATKANVSAAVAIFALAKAIDAELNYDEFELYRSIEARENKQDEIETAWDMHNGEWDMWDDHMPCGCCRCCGCSCDERDEAEYYEEPAYMYVKAAAWLEAIKDGIVTKTQGVSAWECPPYGDE